MTKQIIICYEKHGDFYWDASTPEIWAKNSLAILTERWNSGYWYRDPDNYDNNKWAQERKAQQDKALALTQEQVETLPTDARRSIVRLRVQAQREINENRQEREWYARAKEVVENQDAGMQTIGRNRYAREVPKAWQLLAERSDYEYERIALEELQGE